MDRPRYARLVVGETTRPAQRSLRSPRVEDWTEAYGGPKPLGGGDTTWTVDLPKWQTCREVPKLHNKTSYTPIEITVSIRRT